MVSDLSALDAMGDFRVEAIAWTDKDDFRVGVEEVQYPTCSDLGCGVNVNTLRAAH